MTFSAFHLALFSSAVIARGLKSIRVFRAPAGRMRGSMALAPRKTGLWALWKTFSMITCLLLLFSLSSEPLCLFNGPMTPVRHSGLQGFTQPLLRRWYHERLISAISGFQFHGVKTPNAVELHSFLIALLISLTRWVWIARPQNNYIYITGSLFTWLQRTDQNSCHLYLYVMTEAIIGDNQGLFIADFLSFWLCWMKR